jgi:hypothetical protein
MDDQQAYRKLVAEAQDRVDEAKAELEEARREYDHALKANRWDHGAAAVREVRWDVKWARERVSTALEQQKRLMRRGLVEAQASAQVPERLAGCAEKLDGIASAGPASQMEPSRISEPSLRRLERVVEGVHCEALNIPTAARVGCGLERQAGPSRLTDAQVAIVYLVMNGWENRRITERVGWQDDQMVRKHLREARERVDAQTNEQLVAYCLLYDEFDRVPAKGRDEDVLDMIVDGRFKQAKRRRPKGSPRTSRLTGDGLLG